MAPGDDGDATDPYALRVQQASQQYQDLLTNPSATITQLADAAYTWQLLRSEAQQVTTSTDPDRWERDIRARAQRELHYETSSSQRGDAYQQKIEEMRLYGEAIEENPELLQLAWPEDKRGPYGLWFPDRFNPALQAALQRFDAELQMYVAASPVDAKFLALSKEKLLYKFITERPGPYFMLRLTQPDNTIGGEPERGKGFVTAAERLDKVLIEVGKTHADQFDPDHQAIYAEGLRNEKLMLNSDQVAQDYKTNYPAIDKLFEPSEKASVAPIHDVSDGWGYLKPEGTEQPMSILITDMVISCIPFGVGQGYTALEAATGYNIFGYPFSKTERLILGASVLIPYGAKWAKISQRAGKAAVEITMAEEGVAKLGASAEETAAKASLTPAEEASFKAAQQAGARMAAVGNSGIVTILRAAESIFQRKGLSSALKLRVMSVLEALVTRTPTLVPKLTHAALEVLAAIVKKYPVLARLDALALERILSVAERNNIRGKVVEELFYFFIRKELQGASARMIANWFKIPAKAVVGVEKIEFIAGPIIRDVASRELTDGMLAVREVVQQGGTTVNRIRIFAVFEMKSGVKGAEELAGRAAKTFEELAPQTQERLLSKAKAAMAGAEEAAAQRGQKVATTAEEQLAIAVKDYLDSTSQIVKDVDRLMPVQGVARKILIDGVEHEVVLEDSLQFFGIGPSDSFFFGVDGLLTRDVIRPAYEAAEKLIRAKGFQFFFWPMKLTYDELDLITEVFFSIASGTK